MGLKIAPIEVKLIDLMGSDLSVVNAARVSFDKESDWDWDEYSNGVYIEPPLKSGDVKLINYLAKHKHFSPFNHAFITVRVKAPIFVARQLVKHKFMPWNEISRRYVDSEPEFYIPELRAKADNVKQGSSSEVVEYEMTKWYDGQNITELCLNEYKGMLSAGICPELARMVLPLNTMTEWIWSGTLGAFADMLKLRLDPHTQKESRDVAELIYQQIEPLFPVSLKALLDNK